MSSSESKKVITLISSDGEEHTVEESAAKLSVTLKNLLEDVDSLSATIPVPNVEGKILAKVIQYCQKHTDGAVTEEEANKFDAELVDVNQAVLYDLLMAANFLDVTKLLHMVCDKVASIIRGKTPEQIREYFHIKNDFTREEEEEIRKQNSWAFE